MKKFFIIYLLILLGCSNFKKPFTEGQEYYIIHKEVFKTTQHHTIIEFFSFLCPYCYNLEKKYNINYYIKKKYS